MARRAMVFFLALCLIMLGWAAMAMGDKLDGRSGCPAIHPVSIQGQPPIDRL